MRRACFCFFSEDTHDVDVIGRLSASLVLDHVSALVHAGAETTMSQITDMRGEGGLEAANVQKI